MRCSVNSKPAHSLKDETSYNGFVLRFPLMFCWTEYLHYVKPRLKCQDLQKRLQHFFFLQWDLQKRITWAHKRHLIYCFFHIFSLSSSSSPPKAPQCWAVLSTHSDMVNDFMLLQVLSFSDRIFTVSRSFACPYFHVGEAFLFKIKMALQWSQSFQQLPQVLTSLLWVFTGLWPGSQNSKCSSVLLTLPSLHTMGQQT